MASTPQPAGRYTRERRQRAETPEESSEESEELGEGVRVEVGEYGGRLERGGMRDRRGGR